MQFLRTAGAWAFALLVVAFVFMIVAGFVSG
jgi:hypothetical protein